MDEDLREVFIEEGTELLQTAEENLLVLENDPGNSEALNALFRVMHTFKGSAGVIGFDYIQGIAHKFENFLDKVRNREISLNGDMVSLLLKAKDFFTELMNLIEKTGSDSDASSQEKGTAILLELDGLAVVESSGSTVKNNVNGKNVLIRENTGTGYADWRIILKFHEDFFLTGMDPYSFINYLPRIGTISSVKSTVSYNGGFSSFDPEKCYMEFEITVNSSVGQKGIMDVFEFILEDCDVTVEILKPVEQKKTHAKIEQRTNEYRSIRMDAKKLDNVINIVGELVTTTSGILQVSRDIKNSKLEEISSNLSRLVNNLRDYSMELRMVPIDESLGRFKRLIRDMGKEFDKEIEFEIKGGETELDKTFIEKIQDPLVHLIRNSLDHGIESHGERLANGKAPKGLIKIEAYNDSGNIVIEIFDDGRGLDRDKIGQKAVKMGIIDDYKLMNDEEVYALIFHPGLSTSEKVTNISGRGVGMDVVKRNIEELNGDVSISSKKGKFTKVKIRLPLTLAIIDGFLVDIAREKYIIPLNMVIECIEIDKAELKGSGSGYINLRGKMLQYIDLHKIFERENEEGVPNSIVVVDYPEFNLGFVVDEIYGEIQAVIKPLGEMCKEMDFFSGASILGDNIALIVDVQKMVKLYDNLRKQNAFV